MNGLVHGKNTFRNLHRSVRFAEISAISVVLALIAAAGLTLGVLYFESEILTLHEQVVQRSLVWGGLPAEESGTLAAPRNIEATYPVVRFPTYSTQPALAIGTGLITTIMLLAVCYFIRLSRTLIILLLSLLGASVVNLWLGGAFGTDAGSFTTIWLRYEFVIWLAVPWLMAVFAGIILPAGWAPLFWVIVPLVYGILWSAARLAFCIGILAFTGPLLGPVLWFAMGALADMLYIAVFYSFIAAHGSRLRRNEGT